MGRRSDPSLGEATDVLSKAEERLRLWEAKGAAAQPRNVGADHADARVATRRIASAPQEQLTLGRSIHLAAQAILDKELEPQVRRFSGTFQRLVDKADRPWEAWFLRGAAVAISAVCSGWLDSHFFGR